MQNSTLAKIALTVAVVLGGGGFLVYSSVSQAQHYGKVDELLGAGLDTWKGKELKVHGVVMPGSIAMAVVDQQTRRTFVLESNGKRIRVFFNGPIPDTFKDKSEVVATGHLVPAPQFQARADAVCAHAKDTQACPIHADAEQAYVVDSTEIQAKCPSRYSDAPPLKIEYK